MRLLGRFALGLGAVLLLVLAVGWGWLQWYGARSQDPTFFEDAIAGFEAADLVSPPPPGVIVFTGSSSVRLWSSLEEDMAPLPVLNRGFGGSQMSHVVHFAERVILAYEPRAVVVYAGDNDLDERTGKTAETVRDDFRKLLRILHAARPELPVYFLTIKPSQLRWERWPEMDRANRLIAELAADDPRVRVVDIGPALLGPDGTPRDDVFVFDGLHLNETGYAGWTRIVRPVLLRDLGASLPSAGS